VDKEVPILLERLEYRKQVLEVVPNILLWKI